jgi:hypothetical protein
MDQR